MQFSPQRANRNGGKVMSKVVSESLLLTATVVTTVVLFFELNDPLVPQTLVNTYMGFSFAVVAMFVLRVLEERGIIKSAPLDVVPIAMLEGLIILTYGWHIDPIDTARLAHMLW